MQFAQLLGAAQVIATTSTPEKAALARAAGADATVDYRQSDAAAQVRAKLQTLMQETGLQVNLDALVGDLPRLPADGCPAPPTICSAAFGLAFGLASGGEFELATRGEFDIAAISVERAYLDAYSQRVDGVHFVGALQGNDVLEGGAESNAVLRDLLLATLATARDNPQALGQEPLRRALTHSLCDALINRFGQPPSAAHPGDITAATRQRVVREARRFMAAHAEEPINVPDLCEAIHVSRRTLQYSFQDVLQMSPVTYLRALRLNGVRRDLRRGGDEPVADRAARWGFWHLSRFAADYKHMFGELPSETLRHARGVLVMH